jgi:hypothetical protein
MQYNEHGVTMNQKIQDVREGGKYQGCVTGKDLEGRK